ncbi:MAG: hypothetical protein ACREJO_06920 [Phycisphaerales bacterium]
MVACRAIGLSSVAVVLVAVGLGAAPRAAEPVKPAVAAAPARTGWNAPVTAEFRDAPLHTVMGYLGEAAGASIDVLWKTDKQDGWDREHLVTLSLKDGTVMEAIERVVRTMNAEGMDSSWQVTAAGVMQVGTKDRLDQFKRLEVYDVNDLLFAMPMFDQAPEIDLQQVLSGSGAPFTFGRREARHDAPKTREDRGEELVQVVTSLVEGERWGTGGGSSGTIRYYQGTLIVNAPGYMHRGLAGWVGKMREGK